MGIIGSRLSPDTAVAMMHDVEEASAEELAALQVDEEQSGEEEEEEEENPAWAEYYEKIDKIEHLRDSKLYKKSALEMLLFGEASDETDKMLFRLFKASRRGFRCLESWMTINQEPTDFSDYVRGGLEKLIDTTLVSCDDPWDYTVGLVDYMIKILERKDKEDFDEKWYLIGRRTFASFPRAFSRLRDVSHDVEAKEKIHNLVVICDLLLSADYSVLKDLAVIVGREDIKHILVPEWTRTYGVLIPSDELLFKAGGGVLAWRAIMKELSKIRGFEKVSNTAECSLFDFFVLPPIMFLIAAYLFLEAETSAGFTVIAIATGIFLSQELGFAHDLKPKTMFQRINHTTAGLGAYVLLNAAVETLTSALPTTDRRYLLFPAVLAVLTIFLYGMMWISIMRRPLSLVLGVISDLPDIYDKNGKALYHIPKENLALSAIVEAMIKAKGSVKYIHAARLSRTGDASTFSPSLQRNPKRLQQAESLRYRLFTKTKV